MKKNNKFIRTLVVNAQHGNNAAFEQLYQMNVDRIYALLLRLTAHKTYAENITQRVFVKAWQKLALVREDFAFASWLVGLTIHDFLNDWPRVSSNE